MLSVVTFGYISTYHVTLEVYLFYVQKDYCFSDILFFCGIVFVINRLLRRWI